MINMQNAIVPVGPLYLVLSARGYEALYEKRLRHPDLPDPNTMLRDLYELNQAGGIPAIIKNDRNGQPQLILYTSSYFIALYVSSREDGYIISYLEPLHLREHKRLTEGAFWIRAQGWYFLNEVRLIPRGNSSYWTTIYQAWYSIVEARKQRSPQQEGYHELSYAHKVFLDTIDDLIDVTSQLEMERNSLNSLLTYKSVETVGIERNAPRDVYTFHLAEIPQLNEKSMLGIKDTPDLRGRVIELEGTKLTLKFEALIDRRRIPEQGNLELVANSVIYQKQREAIDILREQEAKNPYILSILVDQIYQHYQPSAIPWESSPGLQMLSKGEQFEAFRRALTVPDLLMVLGPPGTGKTRTITEIVRYCALGGQRVLVTSGTHKAVDNVLERMPPELSVIRVGHENNISEKMRLKLIDKQAQAMQETIRERTGERMEALSAFLAAEHEIETLHRELTRGTQHMEANERRLPELYEYRRSIAEHISAPFKGLSESLNAKMRGLKTYWARLQADLDNLHAKQTHAQAREQQTLIGWFFALLQKYYTSRVTRKQQDLEDAKRHLQATQQEQTALTSTIREALLGDVTYQQYTRLIKQSEEEQKRVWADLLPLARALNEKIAPLIPQQAPLEPAKAQTLQRYLRWYQQKQEVLRRRASLLLDWREQLQRSDEQLHPELLTYADVIGTTCIGTATAKNLDSVEFDLVIVDEAGQIGLPDLLVPLVRARRAVLVGDHNQLPPFVDSDVKTWLKSSARSDGSYWEESDETADSALIENLLTKSAFELLFTAKEDREHIVRFTQQGRMPRVIADFVSKYFYEGLLGTFEDEKMRHTVDNDPLFRRSLVVVDTSEAPPALRWEQELRKLENLSEAGYTNQAEAITIASIVEVYQRTGKQWIVIVPYRAQARHIIQELRKRLDSDEVSLEERVATIDSFQGGERNKVIYGFTRSNQHGKIGFLKELRRLNVAMTRAQQQLILVGNFSTLTQANDARFRHIVADLQMYTAKYGELLSYETCLKRVRSILDREKKASYE